MDDVAQHGVKRKISALSLHDDVGSILRQRLHHELREIKKATKKAKSFEVRKIIKRLKLLQSKGADVLETEDLEAQLLVVKHLDVENTRNTAFITKIRKNKQLGTNDILQGAIDDEIGSNLLAQTEAGTSAYRAQSRLLSSRTLAEQVANAVKSLELILDPSHAENDTPGKDISKKARAAKNPASSKVAGDKSRTITMANGDVDDVEVGWESGSVSGRNESGTIEEDAHGVSHDEMADEPSDEEIQYRTISKSASHEKSSGLQSTFLPSLSVGFVRGDSDDSDLDESEAKAADPGRKNRRGQRARRAIWEKKYGRNANHKKKELEQRMHSVKTRELNSKQRHGHNIDKEHADTKANIRQDKKQERSLTSNASDRPLHPSWEAKRRLKEKMAASIVPSQGQKIVF